MLGAFSHQTADSAAFLVPPYTVHSGKINTVSIDVPRAGPVGLDSREIGFGFEELSLRSVRRGDKCTAPASPDYVSVPYDWKSGCYGLEGHDSKQWRWCGNEGIISVRNAETRPLPVTLATEFSTGYEMPFSLEVTGSGFREKLSVARTPRAYARTVVLSPGENRIRFLCQAPKVEAPGDPRTMVLRLDGFRLEKAQYAEDAPPENTSRSAPLVLWGTGFYGPETSGDSNWRWCQSHCEMTIVSDTSKTAEALIEATLLTGYAQHNSVQIRSGLITKTYQVTSGGVPISEPFQLPAGKHLLSFSTDARAVNAPGDPRTMILQVRNLRVRTTQ
jgi:hypothetical protein